MRVDPIKPTLKALGTERLILKCDKLLSNYAFKFNLRRYTMEEELETDTHNDGAGAVTARGLHVTSHDLYHAMHEGSAEKEKVYSALCWAGA